MWAVCVVPGCVRERTEDFPWSDGEPLPVVFSILTPGVPAQVALSETLQNGVPPAWPVYPQAEVYMAPDGGDWVKLARLYPDTALYADTLRALNIAPGMSYRLRVETGRHTLTAETTLPDRPGRIKRAVFARYRTDTVYMGDSAYTNTIGSLRVEMELPDYGQRKYILYRNGYSPGDELFIGSPVYTDPAWLGRENDSLQIISPDPWLTRYYQADHIADLIVLPSYTGIHLVDAIMSFSGSLPAYSNIRNGGIGLFGSYLIESKEVECK